MIAGVRRWPALVSVVTMAWRSSAGSVVGVMVVSIRLRLGAWGVERPVNTSAGTWTGA